MASDDKKSTPEVENTSFGALTGSDSFELPTAKEPENNSTYVSEGLTKRVVMEDIEGGHKDVDDETAMELLGAQEMQDRLNAKILGGSAKEGKPLWLKAIGLLLASAGLLYFSAGKNDNPTVQLISFGLSAFLLLCAVLISIYGIVVARSRNERIIYSIEGIVALLLEIVAIRLMMG